MDPLEAIVKVRFISVMNGLSYQWNLKYSKNISTSDTKTYLGCRDLWLNIPADKVQTFRCFPKDLPWTCTLYAKIAG